MGKRAMRFLMLTLLLPCCLQGTHLVGGEITYKCLGNGQYEITLIIYRDCTTATPLDAAATVTVFDANNNIVANKQVALQSVSTLPLKVPNDCTTPPTNVCTQKGVYKSVFNLPPATGGYTISHQRCCRNNTITNINNINSDWGSTYSTSIPSNDNCNSSPKFADDPPVVLCLDQKVSLDLSAHEPDGDSLYYELCSVLHGGAASPPSAIAPDPSAPPPYMTVPFIGGFSTTYPIASAPAFAIDPATGILEGKPMQVGQFVFAICVREYRNGMLLSTTRRDFQFNVSSECQSVTSIIADQELTASNMCSGGRIHFTSLSTNASSFLWDFGDPSTNADSSVNRNPTYTYPDTGIYYVTLVAEPYKDCADTSVAVFEVFESPEVSFTHNGNYCAETNSVNFDIRGNYSENATFQWEFGGNIVAGDPTAESPTKVKYATSGMYHVTVEVDDFGCVSRYSDSVMIADNPVIGEEVPIGSFCAPHTVKFVDQTQAMGTVQHYWFFGDGEVSYEASPEHTYTVPGEYTVQHAIRTMDGCLDSAHSIYEKAITVLPVPDAGLEVSPKEQSIYEPHFTITNTSEGHDFSRTILPDGTVIEDFESTSFSVKDSGDYEIVHIVGNIQGCFDTTVENVSVTTPFNLYIPKAFTPNGDGVNDYFSFAVTDVHEIIIEIYNRWGEIVFSSSDLDARWNGKVQNGGKPAPEGVYSFVLIADVKKGGYQHTERGVIHLIR